MSVTSAQEHVVDGETVRWLEQGNGRPVVLVHGIPTSPRLWRHVLPLVRGRCLAWRCAATARRSRRGRAATSA
jgi:pimeloyl-ACP methyl ester carboxylesterase